MCGQFVCLLQGRVGLSQGSSYSSCDESLLAGTGACPTGEVCQQSVAIPMVQGAAHYLSLLTGDHSGRRFFGVAMSHTAPPAAEAAAAGLSNATLPYHTLPTVVTVKVNSGPFWQKSTLEVRWAHNGEQIVSLCLFV